MSILILFCAIVILSCIVTNKFSNKLGMPALVFKKVCEIEFPHNFLIALIKRNDEYIVPHGNTEIKLNDTIVFYEA